MKERMGRRMFICLNYILCCLVALLCIIPVVHILALSFSGHGAVFSGRVTLFPVDFTLDNYNIVMRDSQFYTSYLVTIIRAALGWCISITMTVLAAYPMSLKRANFPARPFFVAYFMGTMLFSGGMIPTYLVVKSVGLLDTIWALLLPCAVSTYNIVLLMNFMKGLPDALSESAMIDGAGHATILWKIIVPLCKPAIATVSLFIIVGHWNAWFDGMLYIKMPSLKPLQTYLRSVIIVDPSLEYSSDLEMLLKNVSKDGANGAKVFVALLPIMCVYPFLQKHFVKGIVRGSVKE